MSRLCAFVLFVSLIVMSGGLVGQEPKKDPTQPAKKETTQPAKKDDPPAKLKGMLPNGWRKLGLTATQVQEVYKIQAKYGEEIDKLEAKIAELKATMAKERLAVLTPEQKKQLAGTDK